MYDNIVWKEREEKKTSFLARVSNNSINFSIETEQVGNDDGQLIIGGSSEKEERFLVLPIAFLHIVNLFKISFQFKMEFLGGIEGKKSAPVVQIKLIK